MFELKRFQIKVENNAVDGAADPRWLQQASLLRAVEMSLESFHRCRVLYASPHSHAASSSNFFLLLNVVDSGGFVVVSETHLVTRRHIQIYLQVSTYICRQIETGTNIHKLLAPIFSRLTIRAVYHILIRSGRR